MHLRHNFCNTIIIGGNGTIASPNAKGFDHFFGYTSQENAHNYYPPYLWRNDVKYFQ